MRKFLLHPPETRASKLLSKDVNLRPARLGGPRIERIQENGKNIFHCYGFAGYGVTIGWAAANRNIQNLQKYHQKKEKVAILGCGYMGLFNALHLIDNNIECNIYANDFPLQPLDAKNYKTTSQVAGGLFLPIYLEEEFREQGYKMTQESLEFIEECMKKQRFRGISQCNLYSIDYDPYIQTLKAPSFINHRDCEIQFGPNGKVHKGKYYPTYLLDGDIFLNELLTYVINKGVGIKKRTFEDREEFWQMEEKHLINCLGLETKKFFEDPQKFAPVKGHLVNYEKPQGVDYFLSVFHKDWEHLFTLYPQFHKQAVGMSRVEEAISSNLQNEEVHFQKIMKRAEDFTRKFVDN